MFGFFGVTDVRIVRAEGLAMGEVARGQALDAAGVRIGSLFADAANQPAVTVAA